MTIRKAPTWKEFWARHCWGGVPYWRLEGPDRDRHEEGRQRMLRATFEVSATAFPWCKYNRERWARTMGALRTKPQGGGDSP